MRTWVRLDDKNGIAEFMDFDGDIYTIFPPSMNWVETTGNTQPLWYGWIYDDGVFYEPEPPYLDPTPALMQELAIVDGASMIAIRTMLLNSPDIGAGTAERTSLESLQIQAHEILDKIAEANNKSKKK